jgi:mono/diheme cytochrome c family protein
LRIEATTLNAEFAESAEKSSSSACSAVSALIVATVTTYNAEPAEPAEKAFSAYSAISALIVVFAATLMFSGCRQDMHDQPKYVPMRESAFFPDARSARPIVEGTVARGQLQEDTLLYTGKVNGADTTVFPFRVDEAVMARGQERFDIFCAPCHGRTGQGDGMVVRRGYRRPPSIHQDRLRDAPAGHFFDVITNGFGAMPEYASEIKVEDRWAIVAYVRALQLSGRATLADVPPSERDKIQP